MPESEELPRALRRVSLWPARRWKLLALAAGGVGAVLLGAVGFGLGAGQPRAFLALAGALVGGAGAAGATLLAYLLILVLRRQERMEAFANVRPLTTLPLDLGGWAVDPETAEAVARLIVGRRPGLVVECGSGWSTLIMARCLERLEHGRLVALEHREASARATRSLLGRSETTGRVEVLVAPIEDVRIGDDRWPWYASDAVASLEGPIDLLVVDGPPGSVGKHARYPAVPLLLERLADDAVVVLDDGLREDEAWVARAWSRLLGVEAELVRRGRGFWMLDRGGRRADPGRPGAASG